MGTRRLVTRTLAGVTAVVLTVAACSSSAQGQSDSPGTTQPKASAPTDPTPDTNPSFDDQVCPPDLAAPLAHSSFRLKSGGSVVVHVEKFDGRHVSLAIQLPRGADAWNDYDGANAGMQITGAEGDSTTGRVSIEIEATTPNCVTPQDHINFQFVDAHARPYAVALPIQFADDGKGVVFRFGSPKRVEPTITPTTEAAPTPGLQQADASPGTPIVQLDGLI